MCGAAEDERLVAPVIGRAAEGRVVELARHDLGPHRPVEDEDALRRASRYG